jgi:methylmalonyl-CoA epimerase
MSTDHVDARPMLASALVTGIDHVGIAVPDLDAAITWYHDHLGMIVVHEEINDEQGVREAMLAVRGAPGGSVQVQLMAPLDDTCTIAKFIDKRGPGLQSGCAPQVCDCSTTPPAAGRRTRGSTSFTPRTPAASWWSWSSRPPTARTTCGSGLGWPGSSSTRCASAAGHHRLHPRPATPPHGLCRNGSRGRIPDTDRS